MSPNSISYTDVNSMNELKVGSKANSPDNIKRVAEQFESLFMNMMIKSMRDANAVFAEGNPLNTPQTRFYQDMHDNQMSVHLSEKQGVGLADVMMRQLSPQPLAAPAAAPLDRAPATAKDDSVDSAARPATSGVDHSALLARRRLAFSLGHSGMQAAELSARVASAAAQDKSQAVAQEWQPLRGLQSSARQHPATAEVRQYAAASASGMPGQSRFGSPEEFVTTMLPMAEKAAARLGVDPHYLVAQAALETGWGKSIIKQADGTNSHNLFGIKAHGGWQGESANVVTHEYRNGVKGQERADFRSYASFEQSFDDYVDFLHDNGRYQQALTTTANPDSFFRELQQAGYATDPQYANKVSQIARKLISLNQAAGDPVAGNPAAGTPVATQSDGAAVQGRV
ncbi:flagellar assembly peptidoglycan hydrolase FlgJ [Halopseudomonas pelagia]|uniref:flagellar assembly peptidoglycan hydrolase FlgJ n=1 Tax=Halopseudomonas pelagia TaxID=553151 RepID=UPI0030D95071|tara:strand:- start:93949 stop:95142 length:1194 start_codon:yes stop_codon:yes gene_type:complete